MNEPLPKTGSGFFFCRSEKAGYPGGARGGALRCTCAPSPFHKTSDPDEFRISRPSPGIPPSFPNVLFSTLPRVCSNQASVKKLTHRRMEISSIWQGELVALSLHSIQNSSMYNLILFGPPGSGKGTQADLLVEAFGFLHISTGDMFRYELKNETELGKEAKKYMDKGDLVPDEVTIAMLRKRVEANPDVTGIIFDGFPRTDPQAAALNELMETMNSQINALILLDVDEDEVVRRILSRGKSSGRADDLDEATIRKRYENFVNYTTPVYAYYDELGLSHTVNGMQSIEEVAASVRAIVEPAE
jgi:adenylate kinase